MHATFRSHGPADGGRGIHGTFYPSERQGPGSGGMGAAVPRLLGILVAMAVVRTVVATIARKHGGGSSRFSRRREMIAELHRELHAQDASAPQAPQQGATA
jgi:hypothetical protein